MMVVDIRRRIELLEEIFAPASVAVEDPSSEIAIAKAAAFVEAHGEREQGESWAAAMARIMGMTTAALMGSLSDNRGSHYQSMRHGQCGTFL